MITISNLTKKYNGTTVLDIPALNIQPGESFGLVGNNGAGKTTLFRLILDLIEANSGEVTIKNQPVARRDEWKSYVGSFLDENFLIDFLTPDEYFAFVEKLIRELSKGNQKKTGIAAALLGDPQILILDEPFTALDPSSQIRLKRILNELQETKNTTMLISSHDLNHVTEVCKRTVVLEKGKVVRDIATSDDTLKELESYFAV